MGAKAKKRNKSYRPKQLDSNAHFKALVMARPLSESVKAKFLQDVHIAILALAKGVGKLEHYHALATMIEVSYIAIRGMFHINEYEPLLIGAKDGLYRTKQRYENLKVFGLDGPALKSLKACTNIFSDVLDNITGTDLSNTIDLINENLKKGNFYAPAMMAA